MADISLERLEQMFAAMKEDTDWDTSGTLLWGYFFMDRRSERLAALGDHLVGMGYRLVSLHSADDESTEVLHVERIESHTPTSLNERNHQLEALAKRFDVASYDGMDVGPVSQ
jgi:hypothetical protein